MGSEASPLRVFISYSHDSPEHADRVLALADRLRQDGVDSILDQYILGSPAEGWPLWMERQVRDADFVLMICTPTYHRRVMGEEEPGVGHGVNWEGNLIYQHFYQDGSINTRFLPIILEGGSASDIPLPFQGVAYYYPMTEKGYEALYRRLTNQPLTLPPDIGTPKKLPPRERPPRAFGNTQTDDTQQVAQNIPSPVSPKLTKAHLLRPWLQEEDMSRPLEQRNTISSSWWVLLCQWLWNRRKFVWGTLIVGILISVVSTWLTTSTSIFTGTPLGAALLWVYDHLLLAGFIGACLLFLTLLVGAVSHLASASTRVRPASDLQQSRGGLIHLLRGEYNRQITESLQGAAMMTMALQQRMDVVRSSISMVSWRMNEPGETPLPAPASIVQAYDDAGVGLLILGVPGAGKSTLLRELASELLTRAEDDATQPIPVNVNLSSWAIKKPPLTTWMVDRLLETYNIPPRLSQAWIEQNQLLFLLDGLDEVESSARTECIEAMNAYLAKQEHIIPIVVCSRSHEYLEQEERLRLSVAVEVRPLTSEQVDSYLKGAGKPTAAVRAALRSNATLRDLVKTPLMLSIVALTYRGKTANDLPQLGSAEDQQRQVFEHYVTRMLDQRARKWRHTPNKTRQWLIWLAQRMKQYGLTEFYVERLQPAWLPTKWAQTVHNVLFGLVVGLVVGLVGGLLFGLLGGLINGLVVGLLFGLLFGLVVGLVIGLVIGLVGGLVVGLSKREINPSEKLSWSWKLFLKGLINGLVVGLLFGLVGGLINGLVVGLLFGLVVGLVGGLLFGLVFGLSRTQVDEHIRLRPNQGIQTSGRNALRVGLVVVLVVGLVGGLLFGLYVGGLVGGLLFGLLFGLPFGLPFGLLFGLYVGGIAYLQHYCLRYLLWRSGAMPWHYVRFLEETTERILLQRVGGGYRFIHPLFLDYFASLATPAPSHSAEKPSSRQP